MGANSLPLKMRQVLSLNYGCKLLEPVWCFGAWYVSVSMISFAHELVQCSDLQIAKVTESASLGSKSGYTNPLGAGTTNTAG